MSGEVDSAFAQEIKAFLEHNKDKPVAVELDTPGGYVRDGLGAALAIQAHGRVTCVVRKQAASMGFFILQHCARRIMTSGALVMTHLPAIGLVGAYQSTQLEETLAELKMMETVLYLGNCRRLKVPFAVCEEKTREEWYMDAKEALRVGAVDEVI